MSAVSANNARTRGSNGVNDVDAGFRRYFGGASEATAAVTVFLAMPNLRAIAAFGTPSAASLLISAQSSMVITLQSLKSAHFPSAVTAQFSSAVDTCDDVRVSVCDGPLQTLVADVLRRTADEVIRPRFRRLLDRDVEEKSPGEIVTIADRQAEARITAALLGLGLGLPVVAEEAAAADPATLEVLHPGGSCWVLDPLDGTANFVAGRPDYGVQLALVENGLTTAAWLLQPESGTLWTAALGRGAWRGSSRVQVPTAPVTAAGLRAAVFTRFIAAEDRAWHADRPLRTTEVSKASVIDYPALVCGELDLLLYSRVLPWDHLPGALLLTEAGGVVNWLDGSPYVAGSVGTGIVAARTNDVWTTASAHWAGHSV